MACEKGAIVLLSYERKHFNKMKKLMGCEVSSFDRRAHHSQSPIASKQTNRQKRST